LNRILVVGVPRSGTTWVGRVLGGGTDAAFLDEPDNHLVFPFALRAKRGLSGGFHPMLRPGEQAPDYEQLWLHALGLAGPGAVPYGTLERARRAASLRLLASAGKAKKWAAISRPRPVTLGLRMAELLAVPERPQQEAATLVVKSVYAALSVEWIAARFPVRVAVVARHPLNVLASWHGIDWLGRPGEDALDTLGGAVQQRLAGRWKVKAPGRGESVFARAAWLIGALSCGLRVAAESNPAWAQVSHEELCAAPYERFRSLAESLGVAWSPHHERLLDELNRPGSGYEPFRAREGLAEAWRTRLTPRQVSEAIAVLDRFPLTAGSTRPRA
jgi:hypothetical protein